ncbi:hypothetical protein PHET_02284 [Paragonimus heterotremus]|uniref:Uncharacterized protein n=1 Tax=Paragonimus heterotremus TaxID=100268 RepID=A0A8J4WKJ8_9TREM|nr:hypothetical protein PHET_02284 [Paragonimus heterotremus]
MLSKPLLNGSVKDRSQGYKNHPGEPLVIASTRPNFGSSQKQASSTTKRSGETSSLPLFDVVFVWGSGENGQLGIWKPNSMGVDKECCQIYCPSPEAIFTNKVLIQKSINQSGMPLSQAPLVSAGKFHSAVLTDVDGLIMFGCGLQGQTGWDFVVQPNSDRPLPYPRFLLPSMGSLHLPLTGRHKPLLTTKQLLLNPSENTELVAIYAMSGASVSVVLADMRTASSNTVSCLNIFRN